MGIVRENAGFHVMKLTFHGEIVRREKKLGIQKRKKGSLGFSSTPNTRETYGFQSFSFESIPMPGNCYPTSFDANMKHWTPSLAFKMFWTECRLSVYCKCQFSLILYL